MMKFFLLVLHCKVTKFYIWKKMFQVAILTFMSFHGVFCNKKKQNKIFLELFRTTCSDTYECPFEHFFLRSLLVLGIPSGHLCTFSSIFRSFSVFCSFLWKHTHRSKHLSFKNSKWDNLTTAVEKSSGKIIVQRLFKKWLSSLVATLCVVRS